MRFTESIGLKRSLAAAAMHIPVLSCCARYGSTPSQLTCHWKEFACAGVKALPSEQVFASEAEFDAYLDAMQRRVREGS